MSDVQRYDDIDSVLKEARALPEFPMKVHIVRCLESRNVNDYGRALELLNEAQVDPANTAHPTGNTPPADFPGRLENLANRIRLLEASDRVSE